MTTQSFLFEIQEMKRQQSFCKYRYAASEDLSKKAAMVTSWQNLHQKKAILKIVFRSSSLQREKRNTERAKCAVPVPPPPPEFLLARNPLASFEDLNDAYPKPPPLPSWTFPLMLKSVRSSLKSPSTPHSNQKNTVSPPPPPPLPSWQQRVNITEMRSLLRSAKLGKAVDLQRSPPRQKPLVLHRSPITLKIARMALRKTVRCVRNISADLEASLFS
jgi:hypothetical protein